ncbi:MAG: N-acetylmuramic acid 6-phosphate etherase, partial [Candidatus Izimaplasma sp.]|nr:N-acetylmuramic acid 6-phosphate etherase [Candidatus Izimaplasma bacterium]
EAIKDLKAYNLSSKDFVIGIAASGRTPYPIGAIEYAASLGCNTACITTSYDSEIAQVAKFPIEAITGSEPLTGSTRMKSGTAQKLILNMITTAAMVKIGKVYENLMIDLQINNDKLISRAQQIIMDITGVKEDVAVKHLNKYKNVKFAIFSIISGVEELDKIKHLLNESNGNIREALKKL